MYPPTQNLALNLDALSGICGSISIACWIVVFSPQIYENFRRGSADGLSVVFIACWLVGDIFNILGGVLQGILPTMIILAVYYTLADMVLLGQCFWYKGFTLQDTVAPKPLDNTENGTAQNERTTLLAPPHVENDISQHLGFDHGSRRGSVTSFRERYLSIDATHLSKATPLLPDPKPREIAPQPASQSTFHSIVYNIIIIIIVFCAGILGWYLANRNSHPNQGTSPPPQHEALEFNVLGQIFGYISSTLCLGSRIPQLLLNWRRKSTEGISLLFFLFACLGNFTYVLSIFAYSADSACAVPFHCGNGEAGNIYAKYILINTSWLLGSAGTLVLDLGVFVQFFLYRKKDDEIEDEEDYDQAIIEDDVGTPVRRGTQRRRSVAFADGD